MSGPGRPTLYKPEHASRARELCARGATSRCSIPPARAGAKPATGGNWRKPLVPAQGYRME